MESGQSVAVISDIHGNSWALREVLNDIHNRHIDMIFNLGDSLYGPLDPVGTFNLLQKYTIYHVAGNEDRLILEYIGKHTVNKTLNYVLNNITDEIVAWLSNLSKSMIIDEFFLCHGSPQYDSDYLFEKVGEQGVVLKNEGELYHEIKDISQQIICCGHSHLFHVKALSSNQYIVNPGSVGLQAYDDDTPLYHIMETRQNKASYCMVSKENDQYTFENILVSYDTKAAANCASNYGHKKWEKWLLTGSV
jgi:putative phosphoesterase